MNQGLKIFSYFLDVNDTYLLGLIHSFKKAYFYHKGIEIDENTDIDYNIINKENKKLEECYKKFFIFENNIENVIEDINNSIDIVLGKHIEQFNNEGKITGFSEKKIFYLLKSNYYFTLSKFYQILNFSKIQKEKLPKILQNCESIKDNEQILKKVIDKIFFFYNNFINNSNDNSLLLISNYILKNLCKAPVECGFGNFALFLEAVKNITNNLEIIGNINDYIKNLFIYLEYLRNKSYSKIYECLLIFLKLIKLFVSNINCLNLDDSINNIKSIIILINKEYNIEENYYINNNLKEKKKVRKIYMKIVYYFIL